MRDNPECLFILDEAFADKTLKVINCLDCYALVIVRKSPGFVNHSYRSIFVATRDGAQTAVLPKYRKIPVPIVTSYDSLLIEDSEQVLNSSRRGSVVTLFVVWI